MENESEKKNIKNVFAIKKLLAVGMALGSVVFTKSKTGFPKEEEGAVVEREEQQPIDLDDSKAIGLCMFSGEYGYNGVITVINYKTKEEFKYDFRKLGYVIPDKNLAALLPSIQTKTNYEWKRTSV